MAPERAIDWRPFAGPAAAAAVGLLVLGLTWQASTGWLGERAGAFRRARAELARAAEQYHSASDNQAVYARYADRFRRMIERGWIGRENRLGWIEALQTISRDLRRPSLHYRIGAQHVVERPGAHLALRRTAMRLRFGALHAGDVLTLLSRLRRAGDGLMAIDYCSLSRAGERIQFSARAVNVNVECRLQWYTLRIERPDASGGADETR